MPPPFTNTYLRSPRIAQRVFGLDSPGQLVRSVPRTKFMFKVEFNPSAGAIDMLSLQNAGLNSSTGSQSVAFKVKQVDKPKINFTTVELNQYNKKKLAYTKTEYQDATLHIHDTVDNSILALWVNYFTYYIGDSRAKSSTDYTQSPVAAQFFDSTGWGFRPLSEITQFFDSITVYAFYAQTVTSFNYINPRITSIDWQQKDYASSDPEEVTVNFKYEAIEYETFGQPSSDIDTGFTSADTLDKFGQVLAPITPLQPRMFSNQITNFSSIPNTSTIVNPAANVLNETPELFATKAVAPGSLVPTSLLISATTQGLISAAGGNPFVGAAAGMVFGQLATNTGLTSGS